MFNCVYYEKHPIRGGLWCNLEAGPGCYAIARLPAPHHCMEALLASRIGPLEEFEPNPHVLLNLSEEWRARGLAHFIGIFARVVGVSKNEAWYTYHAFTPLPVKCIIDSDFVEWLWGFVGYQDSWAAFREWNAAWRWSIVEPENFSADLDSVDVTRLREKLTEFATE